MWVRLPPGPPKTMRLSRRKKILLGVIIAPFTLVLIAFIGYLIFLYSVGLLGFNHYLSKEEIAKDTARRKISEENYASIVLNATETKDISLCAQLPENENHFFTGGYAPQTSTGPLYPMWGNYFSRSYCVYAVALSEMDADICDAGLDQGLFPNKYFFGTCLVNLARQERNDGVGDGLRFCSLLTEEGLRDKRSACERPWPRDARTYYSTFHVE